MTEIRQIHWDSSDYRAFCALRQEYLRAPLGYSLFEEDLDAERDHLHFGLFDGNRLSGGAILILQDGHTGQLRQMLVVPELRGRGLGRLIVSRVEDAARERSLRVLFLNARLPAVEFYRRCAFDPVGDEFLSHGISHIRMEKSL